MSKAIATHKHIRTPHFLGMSDCKNNRNHCMPNSTNCNYDSDIPNHTQKVT